ncbi:MAG: hypothetical protein PF636_03045 [Actinomycetota bacterium]|jgi:hypothetical protein|nr:hypothetical protein [Actinomycetota bacterium]
MAGDYGRPVLVGVVMALVVVGVLGVWVFLGGDFGATQDVDHIVVALVTPDEDGIQLPQVMAHYEFGTAGVDMTPIDPDLEVTLAGSSYTKLKDSYPFGGGDLLAETWAEASGGEVPEWIVVTQEAFLSLVGDQKIMIDMPADAEVFDGAALFSFESGKAEYSGEEIVALMKGVEYLEVNDRNLVRLQLMGEIASLLSVDGGHTVVRTSLPDDLLATWLVRLGS